MVRTVIATVLALACSPAAAAGLTVRVVDDKGVAAADVVVYVAQPGAAPATGRRATITQRERVFDPFVTVVQRGTVVDFPNEDTMLHHVYSFSPAKRFELKLYRGKAPAPVVFDVPGVVALGCNVHDWMLGYVVVLDTPLFAKTDAQGVAEITEVPAGRHELMAWAAGQREPRRVQSLQLAADDARRLEVKLGAAPRTRPKPPPHDPIRY